MTGVWGETAPRRALDGGKRSPRRALGAAERLSWSSLVRQGEVDKVLGALTSPQLHGAIVLGPRGVGKSTLARNVENRLGDSTHIVRLFGSGAPTEVPYVLFSVRLARLTAHQTETPSAVMGGLVEQIADEAQGRPVVVVIDELPGIDTLSMGVLMHLVLGGKAKILVVARSAADFPEDLVWMVKDGLLAQQRLSPFSRPEVRSLLVKALGGPVAESVVASLHAASAGNPLVLQALVHEHLSSGVLRSNDGIWVPFGRLDNPSEDVLLELVENRMARESAFVRKSLEKFSLFRNVPLALALRFLGGEAVATMEERGFLAIGPDQRKMVTFAEPYVGETLRTRLTVAQKAAYFQELTDVLSLDAEEMNMQELLTFASWINEAGMVMEPALAIAAAQAALHYFDPQLALACCAHVPATHPLAVQALQTRSRAQYIMANYAKAVEILEGAAPEALAALPAAQYASWAMDLAISLLWVPGAQHRIEDVLAQAQLRIEQGAPEERVAAEKYLQLARFEVGVYHGEFADVLHDLEIGSKDTVDLDYRLNCASLLTMALAAMGRETDAVELAEAIEAEGEVHNVVFRMNDWCRYGKYLALVWSGKWRSCEVALKQEIEYSNDALHYRGGALELALGVVYALAGRSMQSAEVLLTAAAQLEVRNTYRSLELVYSALAFVYARLEDREQSARYLELARAAGPHTAWINRTMSDYFQAMARHATDDPQALEQLLASAEEDAAKGRVAPATASLLGAVIAGLEGRDGLLEQAALGCQGALADISVQLARARRESNAQLALDAADRAHDLELALIERHANESAMVLAKDSGATRLAREAKRRLNAVGLEQAKELHVAMAPLTPRELQVARLAIRGMSNRDIAGRIGVSVRTVEGHLYQVFAKMGIASRAELEKWVDL